MFIADVCNTWKLFDRKKNVRLDLTYLGWPYKEHIKTAKDDGSCEEWLSENDFEAILTTFFCYEYSANASEEVQKIATDQKAYSKCSSCVIV